MDLRTWQQLYARGERAVRGFFAEHFGDVCTLCWQVSERSHDPSVNCCRRTNFVPEIIADPVLGGLAEDSLGHSLLPLTGNRCRRGCAALGPTGCLIPFGRMDVCNSYVCEHLYHCATVLPRGTMYRIQDSLDVFTTILHARHHDPKEYQACLRQIEDVEALLAEASRHLHEHADAFARLKSEVQWVTFPPHIPPEP